jgi:transposase
VGGVPDDGALEARLTELQQRVARVESERDEYKHQYVVLLEAYRRLEAGLLRQQRERYVAADASQLTLGLVAMVASAPAVADSTTQPVKGHARRKPTGRKPLPETLPRVEIEVTPPDVQQRGLDAFSRIGEEVSERVERRAASVVVVRTVRPKYVVKGEAQGEGPVVLQAPPPELPLPGALAGPGFLAETIVRRWDDHTPLYRMERMYAREGLSLSRSTICGWHQELAHLFAPLLLAMWRDALTSSAYLCVDATGVLVQALNKCRKAHFFVVVAPERHVLFGYSPKHDAAAVDKLLGQYRGFLVADAHSVYDHLYRKGDVVEVACWAHARRYWFKALDSDGPRARQGLALIQALFQLERQYGSGPPELKLRGRQAEAKPIVDAFFAFCDQESLAVLDETPIAKAIGYARNQRKALERFLDDGRLPIHNNWSENALRREALGRKNWLFVGNDEGGQVNATFVTLLASCKLHGLEPLGYLRDVLCLLPSWPVQEILDLAPVNWSATLERADVRQKLDDNVYRQVALGLREPKPAAPPEH